MILSAKDNRRQKILKDGRVLQRLRKTGGMAKIYFVGGIAFLLMAALMVAMFAAVKAVKEALFFGGILGALGGVLVLSGILWQKRKAANYLLYYEKMTGFGEAEVKQVDREIMEPDMILIGNVPAFPILGTSKKKPMIGCMITKHYLVIPMIGGESYIRRISDMILCAYSEELPGIGGHKRGLVFLSKRENSAYYNGLLTKETCEEIIKNLKERKPKLITEPIFSYKGKEYVALRDGTEILRL